MSDGIMRLSRKQSGYEDKMTVSEKSRWLILLVVSSALFLIVIDMTVLYTALPSLARDLGTSASEKLWIINAYALVVAGLLPGLGTPRGSHRPQANVHRWAERVWDCLTHRGLFAVAPDLNRRTSASCDRRSDDDAGNPIDHSPDLRRRERARAGHRDLGGGCFRRGGGGPPGWR